MLSIVPGRCAPVFSTGPVGILLTEPVLIKGGRLLPETTAGARLIAASLD